MRLAVAISIALASSIARADPVVDHVLTAPTAWLPEAGTAVGWTGLDHKGDGSIDVGYGLGGLAAVDLGVDTDVRQALGAGQPNPIPLGRAGFRLGTRQDQLFAGQPAIVLGTRATFAGRGKRVTEVYLVASRVVGPVRLHAALDALDAKASSRGPHLGATLRPAFGVELTPPQYPKTTVLLDLAWLPRFDDELPTTEWVAGFGVRYQALTWGAVELAVRAREGEDFSQARVMVRLVGVL